MIASTQRRHVALVILSVLLACLSACRRSRLASPVIAEAFLVDTHVKISVFDADSGETGARAAVQKCIREMRAAEGRTTAHVDTSDIARVNAAAGRRPVAVGPETRGLIEKAVEASRLTRGGYDAVLGGLKILWGFGTDRTAVPDKAELNRRLRVSGMRQLELGDGTVFLKNSGASMDLGGLGEGYLIDLAVRSLRGSGVRSGIVEATGDLAAFGRHPERPYWRIGVKNPRDPEGRLMGVIRLGGEAVSEGRFVTTLQRLFGVIRLKDEAVATSGDYERVFIENGKRYCHIIDPRTGFPAASGCISVTVVAPAALDADALATGLFTLHPDTALAVIESLPHVEGIVMTEADGVVRQKVSSGLKNRYDAAE
ncbi:FAD:protein FMN transferase [bacterium]|nr:FAD:protein FMN transferase [bacterium]